ncbi:MAG TPA: UvrD-helicase domain-containing protein [Candidatus Aquicultor sp.]|jgi:ATP-dependent exoDNAse (exonuclease V) beta subunit
MTEFKPNPQQEEAINLRKGNVFVSAAAGSGKTKAMTERFAAAVMDDKIPVDQILTLTFTNEAAAQLQDKTKKRLAEVGFIEAGRKLPDAYISTIHSFCSRVLKAYPFAAGIDPNFTVVEDVAAKTLVKEAIEQAMDEFAGGGEGCAGFIYRIGKDKLADVILSLYGALRSAGFSDPSHGIPEADAQPQNRSEINVVIDELTNEVTGVLSTADRDAGPKTYITNFSVAEDLVAYLDIQGYGLLPGLGGRFKLSMAAGLSKTVFGMAKDLLDTIDRMLAEDMAHRYYGFYAELLRLFSTIYQQKKAEISALDFEDLQLLTKDLFEHHPEIQQSYRQRFKMIMVDEFQDTNGLQCNLIDLIANDNLFTVGDEFQSIYKFRHADVSIFRGLRDRTQTSAGKFVTFPENFRSREEVLAFVNQVGRSTKFFGDAHLHLKPGRAHDDFKQPEGTAVELAVVDTTWEEVSSAQAEADFIADRIKEITAQSPYEPNDIAILIPKRTKLKEIEDALKLRGIPYHTVDGTGYYATDEVAEVRDLLATLVNPYDDISLIGVLRGPCVRLSDDALYLMRKAAGRINGDDAPLWHAVIDKNVSLETPDNEKLERFAAMLNELRRFAAYSGLSAVIEKAISETGYDLCSLMRDHNGTLRYANIRKLMRLADAYEDVHGPNLAGFVDYLALQKGLSSREGEAVLADENLGAVRIMTVHAAKGLQFPVVFLALSKGAPMYGTPGSSEMVLFRTAKPAIAFKVAGIDKPFEAPGYPELKDKLKADTDDEDKRLLHVAITRAEERLVITGICNIDKKDPAKSENNTYVEWLMAALELSHHTVRDLRDGGSYAWHESGIDCRIICPGAIVDTGKKTVILLADGSDTDMEHAEEALPVIDLTPVNSVSRLHVRQLTYSSLKDYQACPHAFYLKRIIGTKADGLMPPVEGEAVSPPASSFGSIVHEVFENIDITVLLEDGVSAVSENVEIVLANYPDLSESDISRTFGILGEFAVSPIAKRLARASIIQKEISFSFLIGDVVISGRIDALAAEGDRTLIVDYKTGNKHASLEALEEKYSLQMDIYGLALLKSGAERIEVAVVELENGARTISRAYDRQGAAAYEARLLAMVDAINSIDQSWPFTDDESKCRFCGVAGFCRRSLVSGPHLFKSLA